MGKQAAHAAFTLFIIFIRNVLMLLTLGHGFQ
jgi:hypothetical protein